MDPQALAILCTMQPLGMNVREGKRAEGQAYDRKPKPRGSNKTGQLTTTRNGKAKEKRTKCIRVYVGR